MVLVQAEQHGAEGYDGAERAYTDEREDDDVFDENGPSVIVSNRNHGFDYGSLVTTCLSISVELSVSFRFTVPPNVCQTPTLTAAIKHSTIAYSTVVRPRSSRRNAESQSLNFVIMSFTPGWAA